ncbi:MAG: hypothetical protein CBB92_03515 [Flammeovirgaceae bacterium TMED32]|nr:hypothetical protein [Rhodospirillaceae bacterium]OUU01244.1 MAG: hypothetical protein CBB92_03515 [Flammeovirgaceae bacterium TMED32]|tara:strand:+ start:487 stop:693 length:207 start_codon:yes stop_codon:yes gene_type:complete
MRLTLIAEPDEQGKVAWVWYWKPGSKSARPIDHAFSIDVAEDQIEYCGASATEISNWLEGHSQNHAAK